MSSAGVAVPSSSTTTPPYASSPTDSASRIPISSSPPPKPVKCMNCYVTMRVDESYARAKDESPPRSDGSSGSSSGRGSAPNSNLNLAPEEDNDTTATDEANRPKNLITLIADSRVPLDAPICKECADALLTGMDAQLLALEDDCIKYRSLIDDIRSRHSDSDVAEYRSALEKLKREESDLQRELRALIAEEDAVDRELLAEKRKLEQTSEREKKAWATIRDMHAEIVENDEKTRRVNAEIRYIDMQLKKLARTSVLSLCFGIELKSSGQGQQPYALINGFRLARLPNLSVDWPELNAALGQTCLLVDILMQRVGVSLPDVTLMPLGSTSSVRVSRGAATNREAATKEYPLFSSGSWRPFGNRNVDGGLCALLECVAALLKAISEATEEKGAPIPFPYRIRGDKLVENDMEYTVKMQFNAEERWSKAMRCLLLNLKWAIAIVRKPDEQ